jgi:hypothetical protein
MNVTGSRVERLEAGLMRGAFGVVAVTALLVLGRTVLWLTEGAWAGLRPWATVAACLLMLVGATAAVRGRAWGVFLVGAAAMSFAGAHAVGIAPAWFVLVAAGGGLAVATALRPLYRLDRTALLAALVVTVLVGLGGALLMGPVLELAPY